jgi:hypothetical protein
VLVPGALQLALHLRQPRARALVFAVELLVLVVERLLGVFAVVVGFNFVYLPMAQIYRLRMRRELRNNANEGQNQTLTRPTTNALLTAKFDGPKLSIHSAYQNPFVSFESGQICWAAQHSR